MKVLLLADDCNPEWPSLPVVAYKYARALGAEVDITVATQVRNRPNIEKAGMGGAEVVWVDNEAFARQVYRTATWVRRGDTSGWTIQTAFNYPMYLSFERAAWKLLKRRIVAGEFDLVHRISPMSPTLPSPIVRHLDVPFVIGPLNGNLPWPREFSAEKERERERLSGARNLSHSMPYRRSTYGRAAAILAAFQHTIDDLPAAAAPRIIDFPEVGFDPAVFPPRHDVQRDRLNIVFVGRLVPVKLPEVVVEAVHRSPALQQHRTVFVGAGPEEARLRDLIARYGLEHCVELTGQVTQAEVGRVLADADIFAFPSMKELGAGAVVEAMAAGLPCVVIDYGGPAGLIDADRGVKVPLADVDGLSDSFARELTALVTDHDRRRRLGAAAREHVLAHYTWDAKAAKTVEIYEWVLGRRSERPVHDAPVVSPASAREPSLVED
jgi:glycosyltransferase involved in cell wall biosynthesis